MNIVKQTKALETQNKQKNAEVFSYFCDRTVVLNIVKQTKALKTQYKQKNAKVFIISETELLF